MEELGIEELALPRLIQHTYDLLGLRTFFTAGEIEIKAWTIRAGDRGPVAAGKIHSDFEKHFIRAEVIPFDLLIQEESVHHARDDGRLRLEGKTYAVRDGDVIFFRFNV